MSKQWAFRMLGAFPALHRAGLIEGDATLTEWVFTRVSFRPFTGPASLKDENRRLLHRAAGVCFRPFTGPASLKGGVGSRVSVENLGVSGPSQGRPH